MTLPVVTSLPSSPSNGDAVLLMLGASPFDTLLLIYDATYGKWVSQPFPVLGTTESAVSTTTSLIIVSSALQIPNYKAHYDAGLRPQVAVAGRYLNSNSSGSATVRAILHTAVPHTSTLTLRGNTAGATSPPPSTAILTLDTGWQDFDSADPSSDTQALIRLELIRNTAGTAQVNARNWWLRWVAAP